jgi:hypothetical protein
MSDPACGYNQNGTGVFSHSENANDPPQIEKFLSQLKTSRHQPLFFLQVSKNEYQWHITIADR